MNQQVAAPGWGADEQQSATALIAAALKEDLDGRQDATSTALIPEELAGEVTIVSRQSGRLCGVPLARQILAMVDADAAWSARREDGDALDPGTVIASLEGRVRSLLAAERTVLNFMTHLSGVATLTRRFVDAVAGTQAAILDTRKTLPAWRALQKYAVRCGGGTNHRRGLWDGVLIKDNHLAALAHSDRGSLADVVRLARSRVGAGMCVEVEVDTLEQLEDVLRGKPDIVLLDNMDCRQLRRALALRDASAPQVLLEASGGVTLETVRAIAETGVERISIGALTHSAPALDLGFDWPHSEAGTGSPGD